MEETTILHRLSTEQLQFCLYLYCVLVLSETVTQPTVVSTIVLLHIDDAHRFPEVVSDLIRDWMLLTPSTRHWYLV